MGGSAVGPVLGRKLMFLALVLGTLAGCQPARSDTSSGREGEVPSSTPLPTRQTTIDPVNRKLDAAQQDTERRRNEVDRAAQ